MKITTTTAPIKKGTLRDKFLETGLPTKEYFKLENHTFSEGLGVKPKNKGQVLRTLKLTPKQSEDLVKKTCIAWLTSQGWEPHTIYTGGIPTGGGFLATNPAKGIPDCIAFKLKDKRMVYIEWKKSHGGVVSQEQLNWHSWLKQCGQEIYVVSSLTELKGYLEPTTIKKAG